MLGARAVARAWRDPAYRRACSRTRRPRSATSASTTTVLVVVENTPAVHNLVVCTLCSCYPWDVLGLPPTWYKMPAYRSRAVSEPRKVLARVRPRRPARARDPRLGQLAPSCATWCCRAPGRRRAAGRGRRSRAHGHARRADRRGRGAPAATARAERDVRAAPQPRGPPRRPAVNVARFRGQLFVCATGCCCGRTEDGFAAVPTELFHGEWERRRLRNVVHLTIGGCLGPCALANVALLLFDGQAQWFHSIDSEALVRALYDHVDAHARRPTAACRRRPRWRRITSRHRPGSRGRTASRWTTSGRAVRVERSSAIRALASATPSRSQTLPRRSTRRPCARSGGLPRRATARSTPRTGPRRACTAADEPRRGDGAAAERRAGLRRAVAGPRLRHGRRALRAGPAAVGGVPPGADRPDRRRRGARRRVSLLRRLARRLRAASWRRAARVRPDELEETTFQFEFGERDEVY